MSRVTGLRLLRRAEMPGTTIKFLARTEAQHISRHLIDEADVVNDNTSIAHTYDRVFLI
jgi:hypothetical protein